MESVKIPSLASKFAPGDAVVVAEGELMNLRGRVQSCDGKKVLIAPDHEDLKVRMISDYFLTSVVAFFQLANNFTTRKTK